MSTIRFHSILLAAGYRAVALALFASPVLAQDGADPIRGQKLFIQHCSACHWVVDQPGRLAKSGPPLTGLFDRKAGAYPGYAFSAGLTRWGRNWTPARLDAWLKDPRAVAPDTRMRVGYGGLHRPEDRRNIIAYLQHAAADPRAD